MIEPLLSAAKSVLHRLGVLAAEDEVLRSRLLELYQAFLSCTAPAAVEPKEPALAAEAPAVEPAVSESVAQSLAQGVAQVAQPEEPITPAAIQRSLEPLPELTFRRSGDRDEAPSFHSWRGPATSADLPLIEDRCRLKAEGLRWAAARDQHLASGAEPRADLDQQYRDLISRAKALPDCFLWMCRPQPLGEASALGDVAGCFEALAAGVTLARAAIEDQEVPWEDLEDALQLLAEAQSALRAGVAQLGIAPDRDQLTAFNWLRNTAVDNHIFIRRFMRQDDPADAKRWADLISRIAALDVRVQEGRKKARQRQKLFGKVRHKVSVLAQNGNGTVENWQLLAATIDELVQDGLPPSNAELRELLLPVIDELPELPEVPAGFQRVLLELDRFLANRPVSRAETVEPPRPEVQAVAQALAGKSMILIGGERRPAAYEALKRAFQLQELYWLDTREHMSIVGFESYVARPDVALVVLAIRWSSHSFGEVKEFCDRHGRLLVRLPAGYNPNQVAAQIVAQCSERLTGV